MNGATTTFARGGAEPAAIIVRPAMAELVRHTSERRRRFGWFKGARYQQASYATQGKNEAPARRAVSSHFASAA